MSHRGHRGWGRFPTYKMTTVSRTCRCRKWTSIAVLVAACPGHPSNGQIRGPLLDGKVMWYVRIYSPLAKFVQLHLSSAARSCCVFMCPSIDPAAIHSPHSLHCTRPFCCSQQECPSPVIRHPYAESKWVPAACHGRQTMPTVFPTLVCRPTQSNRPTRVLNSPWIHCGSENTTTPLST